MSDVEVAPSAKIAVVEFDDEQKANVAAALQALADQMVPASIKTQPPDSDEIIELLSDSEAEGGNDSDCEIMGFLMENDDSNERTDFDMTKLKPILKQEIKEEIVAPEPVAQIHDTDDIVMSASNNVVHNTVTWKETSFVNGLNINNDDEPIIIEGGENSCSSERILQKSADQPQIKNENTNIQHNNDVRGTKVRVESVMILPNALQPNQAHNIPTYITLTDITKDELEVEEVNVQNLGAPQPVIDDPEETLSAHSENLAGTVKKEPNVFHTDRMEIDNGDERYVIDLLDDDNDPDYIYDSDDESDNDEETNKIVIDLLESDDENEQIDSSNTSSFTKIRREGFACLIHYICPQCGDNLGNFEKFKAHTESVHEMGTVAALNLRTIIDKEGQLCYQCIECNEKLKLKTQYVKLQAHRIKHMPHNDYFKCRLCEMRFSQKPSIRLHLKSKHEKIFRQYIKKRGPDPCLKFIKIICPICRHTQPNRKTWWKHLVEVHDYTDKIMSQSTDLGNDIYSCNLCKDKNRRKFRKISIRDHMLIHEKSKSFRCTGCDVFTSPVLIRAYAHVRKEHLDKKEEKVQYRCAYCDESFTSTRLRYSHYRDHHKYTIQKCAVCEKEFFSTSLLVSHMNFNSHYKLK